MDGAAVWVQQLPSQGSSSFLFRAPRSAPLQHTQECQRSREGSSALRPSSSRFVRPLGGHRAAGMDPSGAACRPSTPAAIDRQPSFRVPGMLWLPAALSRGQRLTVPTATPRFELRQYAGNDQPVRSFILALDAAPSSGRDSHLLGRGTVLLAPFAVFLVCLPEARSNTRVASCICHGPLCGCSMLGNMAYCSVPGWCSMLYCKPQV